MKSMKGKILKKLKTIKAIGYVRPERILQVNASDGFVPNSPPILKIRDSNRSPEEPKKIVQKCVLPQEPEIIDVSELMKDLEDQETDLPGEFNDKENVRPGTIAPGPVTKLKKSSPFGEIKVFKFKKPELDSRTLFDPNLLEAFEQAVMEVKAQEAEIRAKAEQPSKPPLMEFEEKCPPGGGDSVIFYTTGLRGIRKTFEDCNSIRSLLQNLRVLFYERDVSMHSGYKEELWETLGGKVLPPRLFIKGRYIGGADEVLTLHEQGRFRPLLEGIPGDSRDNHCEGCDGIRFIVCFRCNGSRKVTPDDGYGDSIKCPHCNENGILICPICS